MAELQDILFQLRETYNSLMEEVYRYEKNEFGVYINLYNQISISFDKIKKSTPGLLAATNVVEKYSNFLKDKNTETFEQLTHECTVALNELTKDIQHYSKSIGSNHRIISALQAVGMAVVGIILVPFASLANLYPDNDPHFTAFDALGELFIKAFDRFKETWSGKTEPPELKTLSREINALKKQVVNDNPLFANLHRFYKQKSTKENPSPSHEDNPKPSHS